MSENKNTPYVKGKKKREALRLPTMHFVVADDWMEKIGYEGFGIWLKFHTWVDRKDVNRDYDKIPMSLEASWEKLGISKSKFYRLIAPLWEYGLIDIIEYEESKRVGQKPKNIVVYEYPFHEEERMFKKLEKLRDWKKDYVSKSKDCGQLGGRPRSSSIKKDKKDDKAREIPVTIHRFKTETVKKPVVIHRFKNETVHRFKIKTVTVSKLKPNNVSNNSINAQITLNNDLKNLSIIESVNKLDLPDKIKLVLNQKIDRLILHKIDLIDIELSYKENEGILTVVEYASVLSDVLEAKKYNYGFKKYMNGSIVRFLENRQKKVQAVGQPIKSGKKEIEPDWINGDKEKSVTAAENPEIAERVRKLKEKLGQS